MVEGIEIESVDERGPDTPMVLKLFAYASELHMSDGDPGELSVFVRRPGIRQVGAELTRSQVETVVQFLEAWLRERAPKEPTP